MIVLLLIVLHCIGSFHQTDRPGLHQMKSVLLNLDSSHRVPVRKLAFPKIFISHIDRGNYFGQFLLLSEGLQNKQTRLAAWDDPCRDLTSEYFGVLNPRPS